MTITDKKSYTEVCEILKHIPKKELNKIPKDVIEFLENNKDRTYEFTYDVSQSLSEQKVLRETNSLIIGLFKRYFATNTQKEKINNILRQNELIYQNELRQKYNADLVFKKRCYTVKENRRQEEQITIIEYKESTFQKIINFIKRLWS